MNEAQRARFEEWASASSIKFNFEFDREQGYGPNYADGGYVAADTWKAFEAWQAAYAAGAADDRERMLGALAQHSPCFADDAIGQVLGCSCGWDAPKEAEWDTWVKHFMEART